MSATIIVEDGTIVTGANSYVSASTLNTYATNRGKTISGTKEDLLIQAMDYLESQSFKGAKRTSDQPLQWPRVDVVVDGYYQDSDEIPQLLKDALCQIAIAIDEGNDPSQDIPRTAIRQKVGDLEVEYSPNSSPVAINRKIKNALWKLLSNSSGGNSLSVNRG